jgi:hypothetical protein
MAFSGTAVIASGATAGSHPVTLTCSNGTAATTITVTGHSAPTPAPAPAHRTGGGTGESGGTGITVVGTTPQEQPAGVPWGWVAAGAVVVVGGAAGGAYALTRRRRTAVTVASGVDPEAPTERLHR